jgi:hypothetical protein
MIVFFSKGQLKWLVGSDESWFATLGVDLNYKTASVDRCRLWFRGQVPLLLNAQDWEALVKSA